MVLIVWGSSKCELILLFFFLVDVSSLEFQSSLSRSNPSLNTMYLFIFPTDHVVMKCVVLLY